jgi:hypothetical protein
MLIKISILLEFLYFPFICASSGTKAESVRDIHHDAKHDTSKYDYIIHILCLFFFPKTAFINMFCTLWCNCQTVSCHHHHFSTFYGQNSWSMYQYVLLQLVKSKMMIGSQHFLLFKNSKLKFFALCICRLYT